MVRDIIAISNGSNDMYTTVARAAFRALEQFNYHMPWNVRSVLLEMKANYTIDLPADCNNVFKVATRDMHGNYIIMGYKSDTVNLEVAEQNHDNVCGNCGNPVDLKFPEGKKQEGCSACTFHNVFHYNLGTYGSCMGERFGLKPRQFRDGTWKYNIQANRLEFGSGDAVKEGQVYLVEIQSTIDAAQLKLIPNRYFPALRARVLHWLNQEHDPNKALIYEQNFRKEWRMLNRLDLTSLDSLSSALRGNSYNAPKN